MFSVRSSAGTEDQAVLIKVEPEVDLVFAATDEPDVTKHVGSVVLTNTSESHVAFKIKTNNIDGYRVKPFFGIIPLNSTVNVNVSQNPGCEFHPSDKLLIMTTGIETLEVTPRELIDHWRAVAKDSIKEHRLRCINLGAGKMSSEIKELSLRSGTVAAPQAAVAKEKSCQSFCPPKAASPASTTNLEVLQDSVTDLHTKLSGVYEEVSKMSKRQEQIVICVAATFVLLFANLVLLFVVKSCQSATEWYC